MKSRVALGGGKEVYTATLNALNFIRDDIEKSIDGKKRILLKPNVVDPRIQLSATEKESIRAVLDFLEELKNFNPEHIAIGESSFGNTKEGFRNYGYVELAEEYGVDIMDFNDDEGEGEYIHLNVLDVRHREVKIKLSKRALSFDYIVSLAKVKTHDYALMTASLKNMMGCIVQKDKVKMHGIASFSLLNNNYPSCVKVIHKNLLRLIKVIKPNLAIIDGLNAMEGEGPVRGTFQNVGVVIASTDALAADATAARLMGIEPEDVGYLYYAWKEKLGKLAGGEIEVVGESLLTHAKTFKLHPNFKIQMQWRE